MGIGQEQELTQWCLSVKAKKLYDCCLVFKKEHIFRIILATHMDQTPPLLNLHQNHWLVWEWEEGDH